MESDKRISLNHICEHYQLEITFVKSLADYGLIEIVREEESEFINGEQLSDFEMIMHLHNDLDINLEGIDAISHMLKRMNEMQRELNMLKNKVANRLH